MDRQNKIFDFIRISISFVFLCKTITATETSGQCPNLSEISPCSCSLKKSGLDVVCEFTDISNITKTMDALKRKQSPVIFYLKLRHNNMPKLQSFIFLGLDIHHLTIHNSTLAVIEETSLSSIGKTLTQLDISQNLLVNIPSLALKSLHNLLILNINHNKITTIRNMEFEGLDTLEILTLYENKISTISPDAFKGLDKRKLRRINLGANKLNEIPKASLSSLSMLKKLELQENNISLITEGDFKGLVVLDSLGLAHNKIEKVPARVFSNLIHLNSLDLENNRIHYVSPDAFIGLEENLQYLKLGGNLLHAIPSDALRRLHRLRHLDLKSNNITTITDDAFAGYGDTITFLNMQKNLIKVLPATVFETLNSLEILNLQNNEINHIPEDVAENIVDTLKIIDVTDNPLICDCDLLWLTNWINSLRDKDDEIMMKKRIICTLISEHREYSVQKIPSQMLGCINKNLETALSTSRAKTLKLHHLNNLLSKIVIFI